MTNNNYQEILKTNDNFYTGLKNQTQSKNIITPINKLDSNYKHFNNIELNRSIGNKEDIHKNKFSVINSTKETRNSLQLLKSIEIIKKEINKNVINNNNNNNADRFIESQQSADLSANTERTKIKLHEVLCKSSLIHHLFSSLESFTNIDNGSKVKN